MEVKGLIDGAKDTNSHSPITHTVYNVLSSTVQLLIKNIKVLYFNNILNNKPWNVGVCGPWDEEKDPEDLLCIWIDEGV